MANMRSTLVVLSVTALAGAAGCAKDEPSSETGYAQPAASQGGEATPAEAPPQQTAQATPPAPAATSVEGPAAVAPAAVPADATAAALSDGQIAKITDAVDTAEVNQAELANTKSKNPRVKKFASQMITQHTQAKQKSAQLAKKANLTPETSAAYSELDTKTSKVLDGLKSADAASFDQLYISAQVQGHQEVLDLLTTQLIPAASNADLKAQLEKTRTMVEKHLTDAKSIQQSLATAKP
jgi:putative membrane protein